MNRLIRADLRRILRKPGLYVILLFIVIIILGRSPAETSGEEMEYYRTFFGFWALTMISIPIYNAVYSDELKSGIMINVIGIGMDRKKIVLSKLWDCFILLLGAYAVLYVAALISNSATGLAVTQKQNTFLFIYCLFCVVRGIGIIALSSLVLFLTMSGAGGMLVLIVVGLAAEMTLKTIQEVTELPFYDLSYIGLLNRSYTQFQNGDIGFSLIPALIYLCVVIAVNIMAFDKKEMNL